MVNQWFGPQTNAPISKILAQVPVPVGQLCLFCDKAIKADDIGLMLGYYGAPGEEGRLRPAHHKCLLKNLGITSPQQAVQGPPDVEDKDDPVDPAPDE